MSATVRMHEEKAELEAVFASGIFNRAPGLAHMLTYVCAKYFEGQADQVKEYNIAVEALGRPADFDQKRDSIVRVEAHRLRKRLSEYYEQEGSSHRIRIVLPSGQYVPQFVEAEPNPLPALKATTEIVAVAPPVIVEPAIAESSRRTPRAPLQMALLVGTGLIAAFALTYIAVRPSLRPAAGSTLPVAIPQGEEIRFLAGAKAPFTDQLGRRWEPERYVTGGWVVSAPGHVIDGTRDSIIYQNSREGDFQYDIPLKPAVYELHLHFAETVYGEHNSGGGGETSRLFRVEANDKPLLDYFDVISDAHGASVADERVFKDISPASDGKLHLRFTHRVRDAFINAIEILPGIPGRQRPIRIAMRDQAYLDKRGDMWMPDRYYRGGQLLQRARFAAGTDDPELYRGERFGNITYVIPVAQGSYSVTMKFSEAWFGPNKPAGGGLGSRRFDILANGQLLAHNFDVYKEAGGTDRAVDRTFRNLQPNAQGKLVISLIPVDNYACINAIEVTPEIR
ncbi:MAG TPA: malectin domain-containing carbohydrate-binding protein [Bryobacteraceae bacterium]|nr:malectin domain-containing carbohydrate-binding protein [Bryobacteraceae bacterium]